MRGWNKIILGLIPVMFLFLLSATPAAAHDGETVGDLWQTWSWLEIPGLVLLGAVYIIGLRSLWKRAGTGAGISRGRVASFGVGLSVLFVALVSPLHIFAEELFSAHMVQHLLLVLVAAPLFVIGRFPLALAWGLSSRNTSRIWKDWKGKQAWDFLTHPATACLLHAAAIWTWHMPRLYQASLHYEWVHFLEHSTFFLTAFLFWQVFADLTKSLGAGRSANFGIGIFCVFVIALVNGLLGVLISFSPYVWYPVYIHETTFFGLTALEDQQLAGAIMWVPAGVVYLGSALSVLGRWLFAMESLENPQTKKPAGGSV